MSPITHALLPVLVMRKAIPSLAGRPSLRVAALVALAGVLPDVLSPHLTLDERHLAFSHSGAGVLSFLVLVALISRLRPAFFGAGPAGMVAVAYGLHIVCDMISGGVALAHPASNEIYGGAWIPLWAWFVSDALLLGYAYVEFRWLPLRRRIRPAFTLSAS
jgi:hypothetical protein